MRYHTARCAAAGETTESRVTSWWQGGFVAHTLESMTPPELPQPVGAILNHVARCVAPTASESLDRPDSLHHLSQRGAGRVVGWYQHSLHHLRGALPSGQAVTTHNQGCLTRPNYGRSRDSDTLACPFSTSAGNAETLIPGASQRDESVRQVWGSPNSALTVETWCTEYGMTALRTPYKANPGTCHTQGCVLQCWWVRALGVYEGPETWPHPNPP